MRAACVCNNRGGVGKTFLTFQTSCAVALANPSKKVLVFDFSIYSDLSAMFLGGTGASEVFEAPRGLKVSRDKIETGSRVESLLATLSITKPVSRMIGSGFFGGAIRGTKNKEAVDTVLDLAAFGTRARDHNPHVPENIYLVASAGADSFPAGNGLVYSEEMGKKLARGVEALPEEWVAVIFDTDHIASSALTKLALAASDTVVVPCPTDTAEFQRLYKTPDAEQFPGVESLFEDVMLPMHVAGQLRARVAKMIFSKVASVKNDHHTTPGGVELAFTPNAVVSGQMDQIAELAYEVCAKYPQYKALFLHGEESKQSFIQRTFAGMKMVPDLPRNISVQSGVPICCMTTQAYSIPGGSTGTVGQGVLAALKAEIAQIVA